MIAGRLLLCSRSVIDRSSYGKHSHAFLLRQDARLPREPPAFARSDVLTAYTSRPTIPKPPQAAVEGPSHFQR